MKSVWRMAAAAVCVGVTGVVAVSLVGCATSGPPARMVTASSAREFTAAHLNGFVGLSDAPLADKRALVDSSCIPPRDQEVWVIERARRPVDAHATGGGSEEAPGCGALMTSFPAEPTKQVPVPLKHTSVNASITGSIAGVQVTQQFFNPFSEKIEAVYVFPLPENAAVNEFLMTVGDRTIRGIIREREEAQRIYNEAKSQGYVASLLTEERPNIFTQKVANIEPGKQIDIAITYFNTLSYVDGEFEFVFPMVVGPRFNPPATTDGVYARSHGAPRQGMWNDKATEVQYLRPNERSGHDISVEVTIDTGAAPLGRIESKSHRVLVERPSAGEPGLARVRLDASDSIPNKDLVLRYELAGDGVRTSALAAPGGGNDGNSYFSMMILPPDELKSIPRQALELVFVLDCSGSMNGEPITEAKRAIERALNSLQPDDTFQIIRFSNNSTTLGAAPIPATRENIRRGKQYLASLNSEGGTMMIEGVRAALDFPHDPQRFRYVCFLTDGYIGNEDQVLAEVTRKLGPSRIFSFGIGSSVNRYLMDSMARLGRGCVSYLAAGDSAAEVMDAFMQRIAHAAMTDITVQFDGAAPAGEVYPGRIADLFVGRPVYVSGKFVGDIGAGASVRITGTVAGERRTFTAPIQIATPGPAADALDVVWARHKIAELADAGVTSNAAEVMGSIKQVALEYGIMSPYTAFIAVDSSTRTGGAYGTTVTVPVPTPQGVRYDTTVGENVNAAEKGG